MESTMCYNGENLDMSFLLGRGWRTATKCYTGTTGGCKDGILKRIWENADRTKRNLYVVLPQKNIKEILKGNHSEVEDDTLKLTEN